MHGSIDAMIKERKKVKVKEVDLGLYSAFIVVPHTQGAQVRRTDHTVLPANYTVPASAS